MSSKARVHRLASAASQESRVHLHFVRHFLHCFYTGLHADAMQRGEVGTVQLSTDGFPAYMKAIQQHFGNRATHAEVVKLYATVNPGRGRYAPLTVTGVMITGRIGIPDRSKASTSYVERNNWTIRCSVRRFTRLTNAFSNKA